MSRELETRYRRLLIMLPRQYRLARGEELLSVYMESAENEGRTRRWPDPREVISLTALAVRARAGADAGRQGVDAGGLARLIALSTAFWLAFVGLCQATYIFHERHRMYGYVGARRVYHTIPVLHYLSQGLWLVVLVALAAGLGRLGGTLAVVLACLTLLTEGGRTAFVRDAPFVVVAAAASLLASQRPVSRHWGWLVASALLAGLGVYWLAVPAGNFDVVSSALGFDALPVESVVALAVASCLWNRRSTAWLLAIAVAGGLAAFEVGGWLLPGEQRPTPPAAVLLAVLEACLVAVLAVRLVVERRRSGGDGTPSPA